MTPSFPTRRSSDLGPVVLTLPEDMLVEEVEAPAAQHYMPVEAHPGASQIQAFEAMLKEAQRPMFIIGGTRWSEEAVAGFQDFASRFKVPVGCRSEEHTSERQSLMRISYAVIF